MNNQQPSRRVLARDAPRDVPYGYCKCGCGEKTTIAKETNRFWNRVKGEPVSFRSGHSCRPVDEPWEVRDTGYETPCWVWYGALVGTGYACQASDRHASQLVHRQHYVDKHGDIPPGLELDHLCRVRACVNPDHLEPVSHAENSRRGARTKLSVPEVRKIKASSASDNELAKIYNVAPGTIWNARHTQWRDVA